MVTTADRDSERKRARKIAIDADPKTLLYLLKVFGRVVGEIEPGPDTTDEDTVNWIWLDEMTIVSKERSVVR